MNNPFEKAKAASKRAKLFLWGDSGVGKTMLALQFPNPVVLDFERGTSAYGEDYEFDVLRTTDVGEGFQAVRWLLTHEHDYRTLVIDPITVFWEAILAKWQAIYLDKKTHSKSHHGDFYELQPADWGRPKAEIKAFLRLVLSLDMNVVVTAREKANYVEKGRFIEKQGSTFDGERTLPYMFDTVLSLARQGHEYTSVVLKDRTRRLPRDPFATSYDFLVERFGAENLGRAPIVMEPSSQEQRKEITALIEQIGMTPERAAERFREYGADSVHDLTAESAETILTRLRSAVEKTESAA